jgi:hypothetical protein
MDRLKKATGQHSAQLQHAYKVLSRFVSESNFTDIWSEGTEVLCTGNF